MMDIEKIASKLRELRGNISREKVATDCGISISALTMYETGQRIPRDEIKVRLARYYNISIEELFFANELHET